MKLTKYTDKLSGQKSILKLLNQQTNKEKRAVCVQLKKKNLIGVFSSF